MSCYSSYLFTENKKNIIRRLRLKTKVVVVVGYWLIFAISAGPQLGLPIEAHLGFFLAFLIIMLKQ